MKAFVRDHFVIFDFTGLNGRDRILNTCFHDPILVGREAFITDYSRPSKQFRVRWHPNRVLPDTYRIAKQHFLDEFPNARSYDDSIWIFDETEVITLKMSFAEL